MPIGFCSTNGKGFWSNAEKSVPVQKIEIKYLNKEKDFGELVAYFLPSDWDITKLGLIYTDPLWMQDFQRLLVNIGFSDDASKDVNYSEQGMQNPLYVSMDVGEVFLREALHKCSNLVELNLD